MGLWEDSKDIWPGTSREYGKHIQTPVSRGGFIKLMALMQFLPVIRRDINHTQGQGEKQKGLNSHRSPAPAPTDPDGNAVRSYG